MQQLDKLFHAWKYWPTIEKIFFIKFLGDNTSKEASKKQKISQNKKKDKTGYILSSKLYLGLPSVYVLLTHICLLISLSISIGFQNSTGMSYNTL